MNRVRAAGRRAVHLGRRLLGSLSPRPPAPMDERWAESQLAPPEQVLWWRMSNQDRSHAIEVARRFETARDGRVGRPELAGALLHDVGKVDSGLGTSERVLATLLPPRWCRGRYARYHAHEAIGAEWCRDAGSEPVTVALVAGEGAAATEELLADLRRADDV